MILEFARELGQRFYKSPSTSELEEVFRYFDQDHSGYVDEKELFEIMKRFNRSITREQIKDIIKQIDKDDSGKISIDEFIKLINN